MSNKNKPSPAAKAASAGLDDPLGAGSVASTGNPPGTGTNPIGGPSSISRTSSSITTINETMSNAGSAVSTAELEVAPQPPLPQQATITQNFAQDTNATQVSKQPNKPAAALDTVVPKPPNKPLAPLDTVVPQTANKPAAPPDTATPKPESKPTKDLTGTIPISIFGNVFNIGFSEEDNMRRRTYFRDDSSGSLTSEEQRLLDALQITKPLEIRFRPYIANFFENLQSCNTDSSVFLRNKCQSTQLLLWNIHFAIQSQKNLIARAAQARRHPVSMEQVAFNAALVNALQPKPVNAPEEAAAAALRKAEAEAAGGIGPAGGGVGGTGGTGGTGGPEPGAPATGPAKAKMTEEECLKQLFTLRNKS